MLDINDIYEAYDRIKYDIIETPLLTSDKLNHKLPFNLYLKAESLQKIGAFKFRGACNAVSLSSKQNVIAYSSGNHAQAVACAAKIYKLNATIIMPSDAPKIKIEGTKFYDPEIVFYDRYKESREKIGKRISNERKLNLIKPYDDYNVIAGQGTAGLEIVKQMKDLNLNIDSYICCCGGGGLMAGTALAISHHNKNCNFFSAEPEFFDDTAISLKEGKIVKNKLEAKSICDAIVTPCPGKKTFPILKKLNTIGLVASDNEVLQAIHIAWKYFKIVLEPGGAVALATALNKKYFKNFSSHYGKNNIVVMASGGNCDPNIFIKSLQTDINFIKNL